MKRNYVGLVAVVVTVIFSSFTTNFGVMYYFLSKGTALDHSQVANYDPPTTTPLSTVGGANTFLAWIAIEDVDNSSAIDATEFSLAYDALDQTSGGNTTLNDDSQGSRPFTVPGVGSGIATMEKKP